MAQITECILPIDYYSSMVGVMVDQKIFALVIETNIPELHAKFKEFMLDVSIFTLQWFVCLFVTSLKQSVKI